MRPSMSYRQHGRRRLLTFGLVISGTVLPLRESANCVKMNPDGAGEDSSAAVRLDGAHLACPS